MKNLLFLLTGIFIGIVLEKQTGIYDLLGIEEGDPEEAEDNYDQIKADARTGLTNEGVTGNTD